MRIALLHRWSKDRTLQALGAANCFLLIVGLTVLLSTPDQTPAMGEFVEEKAKEFPSLEPSIDTDTFRSIRERPLFHETRKHKDRRSAPVAPQAPTAQAQLPNQLYKLTGVIDSAGGQKTAYILKLSSKETLKAKIGDMLGDWKVVGLTRDQVALDRDGRSFQLDLTK